MPARGLRGTGRWILYSQTVFIAVLAYIFLGERLHLYHVIGAGFILAGVLLVPSGQFLESPKPFCSVQI
jgi:drug/metabolite transporter (DMT)-like permease